MLVTFLLGVSVNFPDPQLVAGPFATTRPPVTRVQAIQAEDQTPTGKFTTAAEVKPILDATKSNWVAVRDYDGSDFVYVTQIWSWRCGLAAMSIGINDEPLQNWPLPPCHTEYATPNAILEEDGLPLLRLQQGSVQSVTIELTYDDLSQDRAVFPRASVLIP